MAQPLKNPQSDSEAETELSLMQCKAMQNRAHAYIVAVYIIVNEFRLY